MLSSHCSNKGTILPNFGVLQTHIPPWCSTDTHPTASNPGFTFNRLLANLAEICFRRDHCNQVKTEMNAVAIGNPSK